MKRILKFFGIVLGNLIFAFGIAGFTIPNQFLVGGTTGIARTMEHYLGLEVSTTVALVNVITFCLGLYFLGKQFALTTIISTLIYPIFLNMFTNMFNFMGLAPQFWIAFALSFSWKRVFLVCNTPVEKKSSL